MSSPEGSFPGLCHIFQGTKRVLVSFASHIWDDHKKGLFTVVALAAGFRLHKFIKLRNKRQKWNSVGKDVIVVHGFKRGTNCVNISPFGLKLECYLRMSKLDYIFDTEDPIGAKKKSPWITFNGIDIDDSQLIMEFLSEKFNKDLSAHLSDEQKASSRALAIMVDEHLYSTGDWWICKDPESRSLELTAYPAWFLRLMLPYYRRQVNKRFWWAGIGRHTDAEYVEMMRKDCRAISLYLGEKKFMMGDSPTEVDCSVFGTLAMAYWILPGSPFEKMVKVEFKNLGDYCLRMKQHLWPDWNSLLEK